MAEPLITYRGAVYPWQCDHVGHMNFIHEMTSDESAEVVARTTLKAVHLDTDARKSCAFADAIVAKAASLLAGA